MATSGFAVSLVLLEFHWCFITRGIFCADVAAKPRLGLRVISGPFKAISRGPLPSASSFFKICFIVGGGQLRFLLLQNQENGASRLGLRLGRNQTVIEKANISVNSSTEWVAKELLGGSRYGCAGGFAGGPPCGKQKTKTNNLMQAKNTKTNKNEQFAASKKQEKRTKQNKN